MRPRLPSTRVRAQRRLRFFRPAAEKLESRHLLTGTVTGRVWLDLDQDGFQDASETQNRDVTIRLQLSDAVLSEQTTNNGLFSFSNVPSDNNGLYLRFSMPDGHALGPKRVFGLDPNLDNDFSEIALPGGRTAETSFFGVGNDASLEFDAGLVPGASLEVFSWNDVNGDGRQTGEAGLAGVKITLNKGGAFFATLPTTGSNGISRLENIVPGNDYSIHVDKPETSNFVPTLKDQGSDDLDSDINNLGNSDTFSLSNGVTRINIDAGLRDATVSTGGIAGHAWLDNGDGINQASETALTGVHNFNVHRSTNDTIGDGDDTFVDSAGTDPATQNYLVDGLAPGKYYVKVIVPKNHTVTLLNQGGNDATDSDFHRTAFTSHLITVTGGNTVNDIDAGFLPGSAQIGDLVWLDTNRNGLKDANEAGLAGADVRLFNASNVLVGSVITTQADGKYLFSGLQPGTYYVKVDPPLGFIPTLRDQGANDNLDSDVIPNLLATGWRTPNITLTAGQSQLKWDAGFHRGAKVGNRVWIDANRNGRQDSGEAGKAGVTVRLKHAGPDGNLGTTDDLLVKQTGTNSSGNYLFQGVQNGPYYVEFVRPTGFIFTHRNIGDDFGDSDPGLVNGRTAQFTIANYVDNLTLDAGLVPGAKFNVRVRDDNNCDGTLDGKHAGVTIMVVNPVNGIVGDHDDVVVRTGTSNSNGDCSFPDLPPGSYVIRANLPEGWHFINPGVNSDIDQLCGGWGYTPKLVINPGGTTTIDVGLCPELGAIEGFVWNDANGNQVRDGGLIRGPLPEILLAIDISGGTSAVLPGTNVGDVNGDGLFNTILDVQIRAGINLTNQLIAAGYGNTAWLGIVAYNGSARAVDMSLGSDGTLISTPVGADVDQDNALDVIESLKSLRSSGGTNYEAALQEVLSSLFIVENKNENVLFFSGSAPTTGGSLAEELKSLRSKGLNLRAFGLKPAPQQLLSTIDPLAHSYEAGADFLAAARLNNGSGFASERGIAGVSVYLDLNNNGVWNSSTEPRAVTLNDDPDTSDVDETGRYRFDKLKPGTYTVREVVPAGYTQTYPGASAFKHVVNVAAGQTKSNIDFGNAANPLISGVPAAKTYTGAGTTAIWLAEMANVSDADSPRLAGGTLRIRISANAQSSDQVYIGTYTNSPISLSGSTVKFGATTIGTYSNGTGSTPLLITFNNNATLAAVRALARQIAFYNSVANPPTTARKIEWRLTDGTGGTSALVNQTLSFA